MKHFALLISILSITFSCTNQKNTHKKSISYSAQVNKEIPINKPKFSPGTIALDIKILKIIPHNNYNEITASIEKRMGSGAGLIGVYTKGKIVSFKTKHDLNLEANETYSFLFRETQSMGNKTTNLKLIKEIN